MRHKKINLLIALVVSSVSANAAEILSLPQAVQQALQYRSEMQSAKLALQSAELGLTATESQLSWQANASAGWKQGLDMFGQTSEQQRIAAGLVKQQRSGDRISLQGSYQRDESDIIGASLFPNPIESYGVNLDYRMPLQKGRDNLEYAYAESQAKLGIVMSTAQQQAMAEQITEQLIAIYHRLLDLQIQDNENQHAIERTLKLQALIKKNSRLGLAEEKDRLSIQARLMAQRAEEKRLQREWTAQLTELQKLLGTPQLHTRVVTFENTHSIPLALADIVQKVIKRDAVIAINKERLVATQTLLSLNRDKQKDQFDVVLSVGNEIRQGQRSGSALDVNEWVGGVRLEYQLPLDRSGVDARARQSLIEMDQIHLDNQRYESDLKNQLRQWYQEWQMTAETRQLYRQRVNIEQQKYSEVKSRYLEGRTDIREMLEAEESLTTANKLLANEEARRSLVLALLSNRLGVFAKDGK